MFPVTYRAFPNEFPVFSGAKKLTEWKPLSAGLDGVTREAEGKLWYCEIPAELRGTWQITSLYSDEALLPRSRSGELKVSPNQVLDKMNAQPKDVRGLPWDAEPVVFNRELPFTMRILKRGKIHRISNCLSARNIAG